MDGEWWMDIINQIEVRIQTPHGLYTRNVDVSILIDIDKKDFVKELAGNLAVELFAFLLRM